MTDRTLHSGPRAVHALLALAAALGTLSCSGDSSPSPKKKDGNNLLFIAVDTLRADHLSCYGRDRETSPNLDALADSAVRFERAYSTAPWTRPSVASMMTGLHPKAHGAYRVKIKLGDEATTLAEVLQQRGYATAGIVSHKIISAEFGFDQGFDVYDDSEGKGHDHISTENVTRMATAKLDELADGDAPFFLFLHYFDPHYNYVHHDDYDFAAEKVGRLNGKQSINQMRGMKLTKKETGFLRDLYDEEIAFTDAGIGRVLDRLDELGLRDETIVVLTADHGEEFLEHGWLGHTVHLYEEMLNVPLIIRVPDTEPRVVDEPVSLVSLMPTLLEILRIPWEPLNLQGKSLTPLLVGKDLASTELLYADVDFIPLGKGGNRHKTSHLRGLIGPDVKFIIDDETGEAQLFDLENDPNERVNLAPSEPERVEELRQELERRTAEIANRKAPSTNQADLSDEELEMLEQLGYGDSGEG